MPSCRKQGTMARQLHESDATVERRFSFYDEGKGYEQSLLARGPIDVTDWADMEAQATELHKLLEAESSEPVLCHNDFFSLNFLVEENGQRQPDRLGIRRDERLRERFRNLLRMRSA